MLIELSAVLMMLVALVCRWLTEGQRARRRWTVGMTAAAIVAATVVRVALRRVRRMFVRREDASKTVVCCCSCRLCRVNPSSIFAAARLLRDESRSFPARLMRSLPELDGRAACPEKLSRSEALVLQECPC